MASPDINQKESILIKEFLAGHPGGKQIIRATTQSGLKLNSLHMELESKNLFKLLRNVQINKSSVKNHSHRNAKWTKVKQFAHGARI